ALLAAAHAGASIVYVTARGDRFTQDTRDWFVAKGFPRGPVIMPASIITIPGEDTVAFKTAALARVAGLQLEAGIGNRASDITAYTNAGLAADRVFIRLAEFADEFEAALDSGEATGFDHYADLALPELLAR